MKEYDIVAVLWDDHISFERSTIVKNPDSVLTPTLTIGFLYKETDNALIVVSNVERYEHRDDTNFIVILKGCVRGVKKYGKLKLKRIRSRRED